MSRTEMYPWSHLTQVGDYFIVPEELKPYPYISMMVSQRNYKDKRQKLATARTTLGTMVMLVGLQDADPPYDTTNAWGIYIKKTESVAQFITETGRAEASVVRRPMTQAEKIARMSPEERVMNLPWWHDPGSGKPVLGRIMSPGDAKKYVRMKVPIPGPDVPYPDYYDLDENLRRRVRVGNRLDEPEEEDFEEGPADYAEAEGEGDE